MKVRRRRIGEDVIVELSGDGLCEHASFHVGGVDYHVLAVPRDGVGGVPGAQVGIAPLVIMAAKGAGSAVAQLSKPKADPVAASAAPAVVNADGSMLVPFPPAGYSWRQLPAADIGADPGAGARFDLSTLFGGKGGGGGGGGLFGGGQRPPPSTAPVQMLTLPAPAPGMAWRLVDAQGRPVHAASPKRDNLPVAALLRRGAETFAKTAENEGFLDPAIGIDPWAYDTEGRGVHIETGSAGRTYDFRRGERRPGEGRR